jgi:hypothetical protein
MKKSASPWIVSTFLFGLAALILYPSSWLLLEGYRSTSWPHTDGVIRSTKIIERPRTSRFGDGLWHIPIIRYDYQIEATHYTNSRVAFASYRPNHGCGSQAEAQAIIDHYPPEKQVSVFYEPTSPSNSVLEPGIQDSVLHSDAVAGFLIVFGFLYPRLRRKRPNNSLQATAAAPASCD